MRLRQKVIFLTGGSTGIGRECAIAYTQEGAQRLRLLRHQTAGRMPPVNARQLPRFFRHQKPMTPRPVQR